MPRGGIADRVADQVLQDAPQIGRIAVHHRPGRQHPQVQSLRRRQRGEFVAQLHQHLPQRHRPHIQRRPPAFQLRDVQQRRQDILDRAQGVARLGDRLAGTVGQALIRQRGEEQLGRRQGLQQVVAGGGHEPRPRRIGLLGLGEGGAQLLGPRRDPALQRLVRLGQGALGVALGGDVGEGDHEAPVGHFLRLHRQDEPVRALHFEQQGRARRAARGPVQNGGARKTHRHQRGVTQARSAEKGRPICTRASGTASTSASLALNPTSRPSAPKIPTPWLIWSRVARTIRA